MNIVLILCLLVNLTSYYSWTWILISPACESNYINVFVELDVQTDWLLYCVTWAKTHLTNYQFPNTSVWLYNSIGQWIYDCILQPTCKHLWTKYVKVISRKNDVNMGRNIAPTLFPHNKLKCKIFHLRFTNSYCICTMHVLWKSQTHDRSSIRVTWFCYSHRVCDLNTATIIGQLWNITTIPDFTEHKDFHI